jgi:hypothetical protein
VPSEIAIDPDFLTVRGRHEPVPLVTLLGSVLPRVQSSLTAADLPKAGEFTRIPGKIKAKRTWPQTVYIFWVMPLMMHFDPFRMAMHQHYDQ